MNRKLRFITVTCWIGIAADFLWAVGLFFPSVFIALTARSEMIVDLQMRLIMTIAGSLMLGWTCLLFWTVQKPVERRIVLLLTAFPVVFGIFSVACASVISGNSFSIWIAVKTFLIFWAMVTSYYFACKVNAGDAGNGAQ